MFEHDKTVGEVVARYPQAADYFENCGIDYCCGGNRRLTDALKEKNMDEAVVFEQLEALSQSVEAAHVTDFMKMSTEKLCDYIVETHHVYLRETLPQIGNLCLTVMRAHGKHHPKLFHVGRLFGVLRGELEQHLLHEELVLFPKLSYSGNDLETAQLSQEIITEHEQAGKILEELRIVTQNYKAPADACKSYELLYEMLPELEEDLHKHIHLENNILLKPFDIR